MKFFIIALALMQVFANALPTIEHEESINSISGDDIHTDFVNNTTSNIEGRDIIGSIMDTLACRTTSQYGYNGRCLPRRCCSRNNGVDNLCSQEGFVCCYSADRCRDEDFPIYRPHYPDDGRRGRCDRIVTRYDWEARRALERPRRMRYPADMVIVHHTGPDTRRCFDPRSCGDLLRFLQEIYQRKKGFPDIAWNFIISQYGEIFEGVGWDFEGYHTRGKNEVSLGVAFIGDFSDRYYPTSSAMRAFEDLLECGIKRGYLHRRYGIWGHSDFNRNTNCPGENLYNELRHMHYFNSRLIGKTDEFDVASNATIYDHSD